jgi:hypothetical protein
VRHQGCEAFQLLFCDALSGGRDIEQPRQAIGTFWEIVTLAGQRAIDLPNTCRIKRRHIDAHHVITVVERHRLQAAFEQVTAGAIVRQIDSVEQMPTVPAVGCEGNRLAVLREPGTAPLCTLQCGIVRAVGGRNAGGPCRVKVDGEPAPLDNIRVAGRMLRACSEPIDRPGQQHGRAWIERHVDAGSLPAPLCGRLRHGVDRVKIPRHRPGAARVQNPYRSDRACRTQQREGLLDGGKVSGHARPPAPPGAPAYLAEPDLRVDCTRRLAAAGRQCRQGWAGGWGRRQ